MDELYDSVYSSQISIGAFYNELWKKYGINAHISKVCKYCKNEDIEKFQNSDTQTDHLSDINFDAAKFNQFTKTETKMSESLWRRKFKQGFTHYMDSAAVDCLTGYFQKIFADCVRDVNAPIYIDGENCCGKTTLAGEECLKVSQLQKLPYRNINPCQALDYLVLSDLLGFVNGSHVNIDRSPISNLIFQLVFYLHDLLRRYSIDELKFCEFTPYKWCEDYIAMHNLEALLRFINAKGYNVLILIDSDYLAVGERMMVRSRNANDYLKGLDNNYNLAQSIAYAYFACKLNYPCIDLSYLRYAYQMSDRDIFEVMKSEFKKLNRQFVLVSTEEQQMKRDQDHSHDQEPNTLNELRYHDAYTENWEEYYLVALGLSSR